MNKIDLIFRHQDVVPESLKGKVVIIIDVLRATSVMATALANGAKSIRTTASIEEAIHRKSLDPEILLAGERNARKIKGFDLGNSPLEMNPDLLNNRDLLMCTTNGTQAIATAHLADVVCTGAFVNMKAVVDFVAPLKQDMVIICSGTNGQFSLDDGIAAGLLVNRLGALNAYRLSDSALAMSQSIKREEELHTVLKDCYHLKVLLNNGFQKDVDFCLRLDVINGLPLLHGDLFVNTLPLQKI